MSDEDLRLAELRSALSRFDLDLRRFVKTVVESIDKEWFKKKEPQNPVLAKLRNDTRARYESTKEKMEKLSERCSDDMFDYLEFSDYKTIIIELWATKNKKIFANFLPKQETVIDHLDYLEIHRNAISHNRETLDDDIAEKFKVYIKDFNKWMAKAIKLARNEADNSVIRKISIPSSPESAKESTSSVFSLTLKKLRNLLDMNRAGLEIESEEMLQVYLKPSVKKVDVDELYSLLGMKVNSNQSIKFAQPTNNDDDDEPRLIILGCEMLAIDAIEIIAKNYCVTGVFLNGLDTNYNLAYELLYRGYTDFPVSIYFKKPIDMAMGKELKSMLDECYNPDDGYPTIYPGDEGDDYELEEWQESTIFPLHVISTRDEPVDMFDHELADIDDIAAIKSVHYCVFLKIEEEPSRTIWNIKNEYLVPQLRMLKGHLGHVNSCAFSPDGKTILSGSEDKTMILWETRTGKKLRTFVGHSDEVTTVAFSPDGKIVASGSADRTMILWDNQTGKKLRTLAGHTDVVFMCIFSPDGATIASASWDKTVKLWDVRSGKELRTLAGHSGEVNACDFSPNGTMILSGAIDKTLKLWNARTGKELSSLRGHKGSITDCAFSSDGKAIISGSADDTLILWETQTGKPIRKFEGSPGGLTACAISPDGAMIASASRDTTVRIWGTRLGKELQTLVGHSDWVLDCAFSPDGITVASASADTTVKLWDVSSIRNSRDEFEDGTPYYGNVKEP